MLESAKCSKKGEAIESIIGIVEDAYQLGCVDGIEMAKKTTLGWLKDLYNSSNALGRSSSDV